MKNPIISQFKQKIEDIEGRSIFEKVLIIFSFSGIIFILGALLPFADFYFRNQKAASQEYWQSGVGQQMLLLGMLFILAGIGLILKKKWPEVILAGLIIAFSIMFILNSLFSFRN